MLKATASFAINRLFILALMVLAVKTYGPSSCHMGGSLSDTIGHIVPGLEALNRALQ